jgi:shikimate kinase
MDRGIVLVGMMGSGKSTVARELGALLNRRVRDTDRMIVARLGRSIPKLFEMYGEATFRDHETSILQSIKADGSVFATGGGIVLRDENWKELDRLGETVFLDAPVEILIERLEGGRARRPLLHGEDWKKRVAEIYEQRRPCYLKAKHRVEVDVDSTEEVADRVAQMLEMKPID